MRIVYYPDPVLLKPAATLEAVPEDLATILEGMRHVMKLERGIGLAAPQVGLSLRIILVSETGEEGDEQVLINPEIVKFEGKKEWGEEGCLSFPGIWGEVLRHERVVVRYRDESFAECEMKAEELLARVLQHEIDHLDGKVFVAKMRESDRIRNKARLQELRDNFETLQA
ncbi:MAG: peptide deformylase [Planctomycetes bacterium]|nr:peptide deformylase [Planctomycetota bacterium]